MSIPLPMTSNRRPAATRVMTLPDENQIIEFRTTVILSPEA
jgi:hypothetical protein